MCLILIVLLIFKLTLLFQRDVQILRYDADAFAAPAPCVNVTLMIDNCEVKKSLLWQTGVAITYCLRRWWWRWFTWSASCIIKHCIFYNKINIYYYSYIGQWLRSILVKTGHTEQKERTAFIMEASVWTTDSWQWLNSQYNLCNDRHCQEVETEVLHWRICSLIIINYYYY